MSLTPAVKKTEGASVETPAVQAKGESPVGTSPILQPEGLTPSVQTEAEGSGVELPATEDEDMEVVTEDDFDTPIKRMNAIIKAFSKKGIVHNPTEMAAAMKEMMNEDVSADECARMVRKIKKSKPNDVVKFHADMTPMEYKIATVA